MLQDSRMAVEECIDPAHGCANWMQYRSLYYREVGYNTAIGYG
ncbi:hypothetical protein [Prochlorococcus sp. MIT 1306]